MERRGLGETAVAGNSLGGGLALLLARERPDLVKSLILLAPAAGLTRIPLIFYPLRLPGLFGRTAAALMGPWMIPGAMRYMYQRWERITPAAVAGYAAPYRDLSRRLALRRLCQCLEIPPLAQVEALLQEVRQPCLLIWGEQDRVLSPSLGEWLKARLPQAKWRLLPQVGHAPQEEAPDAVNKIIIDFLHPL
jgi:pimeloyl-ACP methyl ester carboxylesterase